MRMQNAVRLTASAEASIGALRGCAARPRFLCLNAPSPVGRGLGLRGRESQRLFSQTTRIRAAAAEAILKAAASDPKLAQSTILDNLDPVERERLNRIRNIGIAVSSYKYFPEIVSKLYVGAHRQR